MGLILIEILLLFFFGLLTALITALDAVNPVRLNERAEEGDKKAVRLLSLSEEPTVHLTAINIVRFLTAIAAAIPFYYLFLWGMPRVKALPLPDVVTVAVLVILRFRQFSHFSRQTSWILLMLLSMANLMRQRLSGEISVPA